MSIRYKGNSRIYGGLDSRSTTIRLDHLTEDEFIVQVIFTSGQYLQGGGELRMTPETAWELGQALLEATHNGPNTILDLDVREGWLSDGTTRTKIRTKKQRRVVARPYGP
jgi:hypothetical protein